MTAPAPTSALYECRVLHERFLPRGHRFVYRLFYFCIDLDALSALDSSLRLFSVGTSNVFSFRERDYLPVDEARHGLAEEGAAQAVPPEGMRPGETQAPGLLLKRRVRLFCARHGADFGEDGRVLLLTLPRVLGYQFNPVSFYFCQDAAGRPVCAVAEVTNTYREVKPYFIPMTSRIGNSRTETGDAACAGAVAFHLRTPKLFYVSPFSGLELDFDFLLRAPGERLAIRIDDCDGGRIVLHSTLTGNRRPLNDGNLAWFLFKYPLVTLGIMLRIHWQAARLWLRRIPHHPKAAEPALQRGLYRPHASLKRAAKPTT